MIGEPAAPADRPRGLPPAPVVIGAFQAAMEVCWGGSWTNPTYPGPPPAQANTHPGAHAWVREFRPRFHVAPGIDLRPARLSSAEKSWAGTAWPPVEHSWMADVEALGRALVSCMSAADWLLALHHSSTSASEEQREVLRRMALQELRQATALGASVVTAATLARRHAVLGRLSAQMLPSTRDWLLLQPVTPESSQGLFGQASAIVPDLLRQQQAVLRPVRQQARSRPARQVSEPPARVPSEAGTTQVSRGSAQPAKANRRSSRKRLAAARGKAAKRT